jgi:hypothetical protein
VTGRRAPGRVSPRAPAGPPLATPPARHPGARVRGIAARGASAGAAALALLAVAGIAPASALESDLAPEGIRAAIDAGTAAVTREDFEEEWRLPLPDGGEIVVSTPFSRLALAARQAAVKGEPLSDSDRQEQIDRGKGRIQLLVTMLGTQRNFARWYQPVLRVGEREVKPSFVQNERTPLRLDDGRLAARNVYVFPLEELPKKGTVTLIVRGAPPDHKEVLRAPIDFGKFR